MSTPNVAESYQSKFKGRNGLDKVLGDSEMTRVKINSVISEHHGVATIRFTTVRRVRSNPVDDYEVPIAIMGYEYRHCCKVSDEAAFCLIQRPYISKTLLTRRISPRGSP
ncbi:type IV secretion system protein [Enterobacter cloacae complex sp. 304I2]|uniref:type IV secretion system protein n=1 Tax=Enterobacter cloacae complex sp. 304I2 TaxID=3395829 RepID=UPI003CF066D9